MSLGYCRTHMRAVQEKQQKHLTTPKTWLKELSASGQGPAVPSARTSAFPRHGMGSSDHVSVRTRVCESALP